MKERLIHYCMQDVHVLYQACSRFYQLLFQVEQINPLFSISISSLTATIFRARYLEKFGKSVALIYDSDAAAVWKKTQSEMAFRFLSYLQANDPKYKDILFAGNSAREIRIGSWMADGYVQSRKEIIEINSCFHHAHLDR